MVIEYSPQTGLQLVNPYDFCDFKVVLKGPVNPTTSALRGITLVDRGNALVPIDLVPTLPGRPQDYETWETGYAKMVASARKRGWIDSDADAIRAHIESSL
ncbi:hypothetical protein AS156_06730 [Bradyrhizobium macuxiense]|uniref:Uncharacterized protein n=1 Tax=Bradyrhizobium macuxiense TaxID=1755647 RepID=A0A109JTA8_9BRAD|nr:hypothetical protein AS156_06730 [Bradyrhizobium macuxiense]